jgi:hypothetical protein
MQKTENYKKFFRMNSNAIAWIKKKGSAILHLSCASIATSALSNTKFDVDLPAYLAQY